MFVPASFALILALIYVLGGALLGAVLGRFSADLLRLARRRAWLDAASGAAAILVLYMLVVALAPGVTIVDDRTLGWRGVLLDHLVVWALGLVCVAVVGRQLWVARAGRRAREVPRPA